MERIWISQRHTQRIIQCVIRQVLTDSGGKENKKTTIWAACAFMLGEAEAIAGSRWFTLAAMIVAAFFCLREKKGKNREKGKNRKKSPAGMQKYGCRTGEDRQSGVWM